MSRPLSPTEASGESSNPEIPAGKADLGKRALAMLIDGVIGAVLSMIMWIGPLLSAAYFVTRDGLDFDFMKGRSLGKRVMKLRPVRLDGGDMDLETSFRRNWMFGLGAVSFFFEPIPILGLIVAFFVGIAGLAIGLFEIYKVFSDGEGRRWGDSMGNTKVIETAE